MGPGTLAFSMGFGPPPDYHPASRPHHHLSIDTHSYPVQPPSAPVIPQVATFGPAPVLPDSPVSPTSFLPTLTAFTSGLSVNDTPHYQEHAHVAAPHPDFSSYYHQRQVRQQHQREEKPFAVSIQHSHPSHQRQQPQHYFPSGLVGGYSVSVSAYPSHFGISPSMMPTPSSSSASGSAHPSPLEASAFLPPDPGLAAELQLQAIQQANGDPNLFPCPHCDKAYKGRHARSIWRRHLQDKHHIPLSSQPRRTRWDNDANRPKTAEERRERMLESKRRWARKKRLSEKAKTLGLEEGVTSEPEEEEDASEMRAALANCENVPPVGRRSLPAVHLKPALAIHEQGAGTPRTALGVKDTNVFGSPSIKRGFVASPRCVLSEKGKEAVGAFSPRRKAQGDENQQPAPRYESVSGLGLALGFSPRKQQQKGSHGSGPGLASALGLGSASPFSVGPPANKRRRSSEVDTEDAFQLKFVPPHETASASYFDPTHVDFSAAVSTSMHASTHGSQLAEALAFCDPPSTTLAAVDAALTTQPTPLAESANILPAPPSLKKGYDQHQAAFQLLALKTGSSSPLQVLNDDDDAAEHGSKGNTDRTAATRPGRHARKPSSRANRGPSIQMGRPDSDDEGSDDDAQVEGLALAANDASPTPKPRTLSSSGSRSHVAPPFTLPTSTLTTSRSSLAGAMASPSNPFAKPHSSSSQNHHHPYHPSELRADEGGSPRRGTGGAKTGMRPDSSPPFASSGGRGPQDAAAVVQRGGDDTVERGALFANGALASSQGSNRTLASLAATTPFRDSLLGHGGSAGSGSFSNSSSPINPFSASSSSARRTSYPAGSTSGFGSGSIIHPNGTPSSVFRRGVGSNSSANAHDRNGGGVTSFTLSSPHSLNLTSSLGLAPGPLPSSYGGSGGGGSGGGGGATGGSGGGGGFGTPFGTSSMSFLFGTPGGGLGSLASAGGVGYTGLTPGGFGFDGTPCKIGGGSSVSGTPLGGSNSGDEAVGRLTTNKRKSS